MNEELRDKIDKLKRQLKRGDMARIVEATSPYGVNKYDVYNILSGKSLSNHQKILVVMREVKKHIEQNKKFIEALDI
jgi:hypothetical protein